MGRSQLEDDIRGKSSSYVQHERVKLYFDEDDGRTRQEFAEDCDINNIMARYEKTGVISHNSPREPMYLDFTEIPDDLQSTLQMLEDAREAFMTLPASVRRDFDNDPTAFIEYASDPNNIDQMREWGLAKPLEQPPIAPNPPPPSAPAAADAPLQPAPAK